VPLSLKKTATRAITLLKKPGKAKPKEDPATYNLKFFETHKDTNEVYPIDLKRFLEKFLREPFGGQVINFSDYQIQLSFDTGRDYRFNGIYKDAPYCFILTRKYKEEREFALACIAFEPFTLFKKILVVKQIQGVRGKQNELKFFRWEKMLLAIVIEWARANRFKRIDVLRAQDTEWFNEGRKEALYLKYDVTARRSGFKFDPDCNRYTMALRK